MPKKQVNREIVKRYGIDKSMSVMLNKDAALAEMDRLYKAGMNLHNSVIVVQPKSDKPKTFTETAHKSNAAKSVADKFFEVMAQQLEDAHLECPESVVLIQARIATEFKVAMDTCIKFHDDNLAPVESTVSRGRNYRDYVDFRVAYEQLRPSVEMIYGVKVPELPALVRNFNEDNEVPTSRRNHEYFEFDFELSLGGEIVSRIYASEDDWYQFAYELGVNPFKNNWSLSDFIDFLTEKFGVKFSDPVDDIRVAVINDYTVCAIRSTEKDAK